MARVRSCVASNESPRYFAEMRDGKSPEPPDWKAFEELVARIEKAAAPRNAVVKSPDRIADLRTGTKREVDASIRYTVGSVPILITIECRKRKDTQDITWIEQLITKRQNLGAARTIAVALEGFSKEAKDQALPGGIELRQIEKISREEIETWLALRSITEIHRTNRLHSMPVIEYHAIAADKGEAVSSQNPEKMDVNAKVFISEDGETLSLNDIWLRAQDQMDFYEDIPWPNGRAQKNITLKIPENFLQVQTPGGPRNVASIKLQTELWYEFKEVPLDQAVFHRYAGPGGVEIQRAEYELPLSNLDMKLALQSQKDSGDVSVEGTVVMRKSADE